MYAPKTEHQHMWGEKKPYGSEREIYKSTALLGNFNNSLSVIAISSMQKVRTDIVD